MESLHRWRSHDRFLDGSDIELVRNAFEQQVDAFLQQTLVDAKKRGSAC